MAENRMVTNDRETKGPIQTSIIFTTLLSARTSNMRYKTQCATEINRVRYYRDPFNGNVYMFMSKDYRKVRMVFWKQIFT